MQTRLLGSTIILLMILGASTAVAADLSAKSKISSVTVFPTGAQITRESNISIDAGEHTITLKDLPIETIKDSIRVEGLADGILEIGSVDVKTIYIHGNPKEVNKSKRQALEDQIEKLQDEKAAIDGILKAIQSQKDYIAELTRLPSRPVPRNTDENAQPNWTELFDLIGTKMSDLNQKSLENIIRQRSIGKQIEKLKKKLNAQPSKQDRRTEVKINLAAEKSLNAVLKIHYQIHRAGWRPIYDARLDTKGGPDKARLSITRQASVYQRSNEEWKEVKLSLSTTRPNRNTAAPKLRALKVDIRERQEKKVAIGRNYVQPQQDQFEYAAKSPKRKLRKPFLTPKLVANQTRYANVKQHAFQAIFEVPGKVTIKTRGEQKKVTLSKLDISPELKAIAVPKTQPVAFLSAKFKLPKAAQILGGKVNLYRDNVYIGKGRLPDLASGAEFALGFGSDDALQVKYAEINRSKGETGILSTSKTDERNFKITVKNLHDWKVPVTVMDQIPYSENEKISIIQLPGTTPPSRKNLEDKRGIFAWDFDLKAGQEKQIDLAYKVVWPKEEKIYYQNK